MTATRLLLPALAAAALAGCDAEKLTMDLHVVREMDSVLYHIDPDGALTVAEGGGLVDRRTARPIHESALDAGAMRDLKSVIRKSGFLVESEPVKRSLSSGVFLHIDVKLGWWANSMNLRGTKVTSVEKIVNEVNRHLPEKHKVPYGRITANLPDEEIERHLR